MFLSTKKFNREIAALRKLRADDDLHPLQKEQVKQRVLQSISTETPAVSVRYTWQERRHKIMSYIISTLISLSLLGGTALAANDAKPGDILFPVKKAQEKIRVNLAVSEETKAKLQAKFAEKRLEEFHEIAAQANATTTINASQTVKAKVEAENEVEHAITTLQEVRTKLEAKGKATAAAAINQTLVRLQTQATEDSGKERRGNKTGVTPSTTSQTELTASQSQRQSEDGNRKGKGDENRKENKADSNIQFNGTLRIETELE